MTELSPAQLTTLGAAIRANPAFWNGVSQLENDNVIAAFYNTLTTPAVNIWRPDVTVTMLNAAINWPDMILLTQEKQLTYQSMIWLNVIDMTDAQVRAGITTIFGNGSTSENRIIAASKRAATNLEALLSAGGATKVTEVYGYTMSPTEVPKAIFGN